MEFVEHINRGGFGIVDKVRLDDGMLAARKTFSPSIPMACDADRDKLLKRFKREVRFQSSISSESICPILGADLDASDPWFLMPFAEKTLGDEIASCRASGVIPSQALADVLNALEALHDLGFVHRDLKPQNILFINGVWKLTDFGLILPLTGATTQLTSVGSAWGTPEYAAPEQSSEFHAVGPGADIYAFGCILHDVVGTGHRIPYAKQSAGGPLGVIIERCTELKPERRFTTISSLRSALLSVLETPQDLSPSGTATDWANAISENRIDTSDSFQGLLRFLKTEAGNDDRYTIFTSLDDNAFTYLHGIDEGIWKLLALSYCEWIEESGFNFEFCDVLIQRLETIFQLGDTEVKAAVALAGAALGRSHNRWYVMGRVLKMCGPELEDSVASRLCIDIRAFQAERNFRRCADVINRPYAEYHPKVREVIETPDEVPAS